MGRGWALLSKIIAFILIGGQELVRLCFADRSIDTSLLGGFAKFGGDVLYYALTAAAASWPRSTQRVAT